MLAHKKSISLLLCAAMLLSMFATVPFARASQSVEFRPSENDVYSTGSDVYAVNPDVDVYAVSPDVEVIEPEPDVGAGNEAPGTYETGTGLPDGIYLCDSDFLPYCDVTGNPLSFASLHEAIHAAQAIMIAVHDKRNDGTLPGEGTDEVYYIVKGDGTYYSAGDPAEPVAYTSGVEAVSTAMRYGYPAVERVGEAETAAFYAASSLGILSMVTAGDLASAIAEVQNSDYSTIVLKGSVPFDHTTDCSICPSDTLWIEKNSNKTQVKIGQIEIAKDLDIIAFPGSSATVYWINDYVDRTLLVGDGVTLTLGTDPGEVETGIVSGTLVFDGGARWSGSYAWFSDVLNGNYVGRQHVMPLVTLNHSAQFQVGGIPKGNTLVVGESVTIQNYIHAYRPTSAPSSGSGIVIDLNLDAYSGNGAIAVITSDSEWTPQYSPVEPAAAVHLYGKMVNNAAKQGGAIYLQGGELHVYEGAALIGNSADFGGAVCVASDTEQAGMPAFVFMYGGEMSHNSAFDGGAVALWISSVSDIDVQNPEADSSSPPCTFSMSGGSLSENTAHSWMVLGLDILYPLLFGECGGGAVALMAPNATFNLTGGEITGNRTLPLTAENAELPMSFQEMGHAISANGAFPGDQHVNISGGTIADNGVDSYTGEVTGSTVEVRKGLALYKFATLNLISELLDDPAMSGFEGSSEVYQMLMKFSGDESTDVLVALNTLNSFPMEDVYEMLAEMSEYIENNEEMSDSEKESFAEDYEMMLAIKDSGICDPTLGLVISDDDPNAEGPTIQEGQTVGLGADTYIRINDNVTPAPEIAVSPYANPGDPVVEYGGTNESPEFKLSGESSLLLHDEHTNTWYVYDPNAVYTVTYKVGAQTYTEERGAVGENGQPALPSVTLPTAAEAFEKGWITEEQAQYNLNWYCNDNGTQIKYAPDQNGAMPRIILGKDMTFVGAVDANASVEIHYNDGTDGFEIWADVPLFSELDPAQVAALYAKLNEAHPENLERKVIAAGLTTMPISVVVGKDTWEQIEENWEDIKNQYAIDGDSPYDVLYHTVWAVVDGKTAVIPAKVNPYPVEGNATLYVLWAYDENGNNIPDFLEVTLTIDPNGGTFQGEEEERSLMTALGTTIPRSYVENLLEGFYHPGIEDTNASLTIPVLPVGTMGVPTGTTEIPVEDKIYSINDRETLAALQDVVYIGKAVDYVVTEDETFYAIWSYDAPLGNSLDIPANPMEGSDGFADVLEVIITIDTNGGKFYLGMQDGNPVYVTGHMPMWVPKGATIPAKASSGMSLAGLGNILIHDSGSVTYTGNTFDCPVVLVGLTKRQPAADTSFTPGKVFSALDEDKTAFAQLTDLINVWNPTEGFVVTEDETYYAVWSYDMTMVELPGVLPAPDVYEALLTLHPNGGALIVGEDNGQPIYSTEPMSVLIPIGGVIPPEYLMGISQMFAYPNSSYVLAGITADTDVMTRNIYGTASRDAFNSLTGVIRSDGQNSAYKVIGNTNLYAVWSEDIDELGDPDVFEMAITLDANGGTILNTGATEFLYPVPRLEPGSGGTQITYDVMQSMCTMLLTPPDGMVLYGLAFDSAGSQMITDTFLMDNDTTIYAIWSDRAPVRIHPNNEVDEVTVWESAQQTLLPNDVSALLGRLSVPADPMDWGRKIVAAGLTTQPVVEIVDVGHVLPEGVDLYHTVWAVGNDQIPAAVNPYTVKGTTDLYVLWAVDANENNIPDFLEVDLELQINAKHGGASSNGALSLGEVDATGEPILYYNFVYVNVSIGTIIPGPFFEQIMLGLFHDGLDVTDPNTDVTTHVDVYPVGVSTDETVSGRVPYSADEVASLESLENLLYKGKVPADYTYTVTDYAVFYTVWGYDENKDGRADVAEFVELTLNPNGGMVDGGGTALTFDYRANDEVYLSDIMTRFSHTDTSLILVGITTTSSAEGLLGVYGVENRVAFAELNDFIPVDSVGSYTVTENVDFYAVWSKDEDRDGVADVYQLAITLDANGGTIAGTGAAAYMYPIPVPDPETEGTQITYEVMMAMSSALLVAPDGMTLLGLAFDPEGSEMITETFFMTGDTTVYAIWLKEGGETPPEYSITIEWGDLTFDYKLGAWNPDTGSFGQHSVSPQDPSRNWVTVTNGGETTVTVSFAYHAEAGYESLKGVFTLGAATGSMQDYVATNLHAGETCQTWVWLSGTLEHPEAGTYTCGRCSVIITAIEETADTPQFNLGEVGAIGNDTDGDGRPDYYTIEAISDLPQNVEIPGSINGIPVEEVTKLYSGDGTDGKLNQTVQSISLGEGIKVIRSQALAATPNLATVSLPGTLTTIEGNAFALNGQEKGKIIAMTYNGTKEKWDAIDKAGDWAKALAKGTTVTCTDGVYSLESANGNNSRWSWTPNN